MQVDSVFRSPRPPRQQQRSRSRLRSHSSGSNKQDITGFVTTAGDTVTTATDLLNRLQGLLSAKASEITSVGQLGEALLNQQAELETRIREVQDDVKHQAVLNDQAQEVFGNGRGASASDGFGDVIITQQVHNKVLALENELARWQTDNQGLYKHSGLASCNGTTRDVADHVTDAIRKFGKDQPEISNADRRDQVYTDSPAGQTAAQSRGDPSLSASRRQRNAAERRVLDVALTADIGQNLVHEIRRLGALLTERDGILADMRTEKDGIERAMEQQYLKLRSAEDSIQQYKEENWNTGIELQDAQRRLGEMTSSLSKLDAEKTRLSKELAHVRDSLETHKVDNERLSHNMTDFQAKHELDMANMRRTTAGLQREKVDLQMTIETMTKQLNIAARGIKRSVSATSGVSLNATIDENGRPVAAEIHGTTEDVFAGRRTALGGRTDDLFDSEGNILSEDESPAASPGPRTNAYAGGENEKLRSNLAHTQKTIQALRTALAKEKERNSCARRRAEDCASNDKDLESDSEVDNNGLMSDSAEDDENLPISRRRGNQQRGQRGRGGARGLRVGLPTRRAQHAAIRSIRGPVPSRLSTEVEMDSDVSLSHNLSLVDQGPGNQSSSRSDFEALAEDEDQRSHSSHDSQLADRNILRSSQGSAAGMDPAFAAILSRSLSSRAIESQSRMSGHARTTSSTFPIAFNLADQLHQQAIEWAHACTQTDDIPHIEPTIVVQQIPIEVEVVREVIVEREIIKEVPVDRIIEKEVVREVEKIIELPVDVVREIERIVKVPVEVIREVEVVVEKIVEVPVEVIREVEVVVEKIVERVVEKEVPVEVIVTKEVPIEVTVTRDVPTEHVVYRDVPVHIEVIKEVPREVIVEKQVPFEVIVEKRVEVPVERIIDREVRVEVEVEKIVHVPFERIVEKQVPVEVLIEKRIEVPIETFIEKRVEVPIQVFVDKEIYIDRIVEKEIFVDRIVEKEIFVDRIVEKEIPIEVIVYRDARDGNHGNVDQHQQAQLAPKLALQALPTAHEFQTPTVLHSDSVAITFRSFSQQKTDYDTATEIEGEFMDARETLGTSGQLCSASSTTRGTNAGIAHCDSDVDSDQGIRSSKAHPVDSGKPCSKPPGSSVSHGQAALTLVDAAVQTDSSTVLPATIVTSATVQDLSLAALSPERAQNLQLLTSEEAGLVYLQRVASQSVSDVPADLTRSTSTKSDGSAAASVTSATSIGSARRTRSPRLALPPPPQGRPPSVVARHAASPLFKPPRPTSPPPTDLLRQYTPGNQSTITRSRSFLSVGEAMNSSIRANMLASRDEQFYGASPAPLPANRTPIVPRAVASVAQLREAPSIRYQASGSDPSSVYGDKLDLARGSGATTPHNQMIPSAVHTPMMTSARKRKSRIQASRASISSMSSVASSMRELGMNRMNHDHAQLHKTAGTTDPAVLRCIIQTMCGAFFFKYVRGAFRGSLSEKRHCRYFCVVPYTRTLQWSREDPGAMNVNQADIKSMYIAGVREVDDHNGNPVGLLNKSIIVFNESREVKFTAPSQEIHDVWFTSISCLVLNRGDCINDDTEDAAESIPSTPAHLRTDMKETPSSVRSFNLLKTINRSTSSIRFGKHSDPPVSSDAGRDVQFPAPRPRANCRDDAKLSTARKGVQSGHAASYIDEHGRPRPSTSLGHHYDSVSQAGMTGTVKPHYTQAACQKTATDRSHTPVLSATKSSKAARKMSIINMMSGHNGRENMAMTGYDIASPAPKRPATPAADYQAAVAAHMATSSEQMFSSPRSIRSYKRPSTAMSLMSPVPPMILDESIELVDRRDVIGADLQEYRPNKGKRSALAYDGLDNVRACCDGAHDVGTLSSRNGRRNQHTRDDNSRNVTLHAGDTPNATRSRATAATATSTASRNSPTSRRFTASNMMGSISRSTSTLVRRRERQSTIVSDDKNTEGMFRPGKIEHGGTSTKSVAPKLPPLPVGALSLVGAFEDPGSPSLRGRGLSSTLRGSKSTQALKQQPVAVSSKRNGSGSVNVKREA